MPYQKAPAIKLSSIDIDLNPDNIKVRLEGGLVAKIASLFTDLFKKQILAKVMANFKREIERIVKVQVNHDLREYGTQEMLPDLDQVAVDYSLLREPIVKDYIAAELNGTFFRVKNPEPSKERPIVIPYRDLEGKAFQMFLTEYTLNTFHEALFSSDAEISFTDMLSKYLGLRLTTNHVGLVIP